MRQMRGGGGGFYSKGEGSERRDGNVRLTSLWVDGFSSAEILFPPHMKISCVYLKRNKVVSKHSCKPTNLNQTQTGCDDMLLCYSFHPPKCEAAGYLNPAQISLPPFFPFF